jgi:hypothetical protein
MAFQVMLLEARDVVEAVLAAISPQHARKPPA